MAKTRYSIPPFGVDVFEGSLSGLIMAEAEFEDDGTMESFEPPSWVGREVTQDERFSGGYLANLEPESLARLF